MGKVWIVLINKSPRGPLTIEEVNSLLSEKILKRTDLALKLNPELPDEKNHWKFLWQYEEFDQRLNKEPIPELKIKSPELAEERRAKLSTNEIKTQISKELPDEIAMINPEDLVVTSRKTKDRGLSSFVESDGEKDIDTLPYESENSKSLFPRVALVAIVLVALVVYLKQRVNSLLVSKEENPISNAARVPAETLTPPTKTKPSLPIELKRNVSQEKPRQEAPQPPKQNEISLEEYRKLKDERDEKDREEEQERERIKEAEKRLSEGGDDQREVAEDEGATEDSSLELPLKKAKNAKTKKKSKRRAQDEEESDRDSQQRDDSHQENQVESQEENRD